MPENKHNELDLTDIKNFKPSRSKKYARPIKLKVASSPHKPLAVAKEILATWSFKKCPTRVVWNGTWMQWEGTNWKETSDARIKSDVYRQLDGAVYTKFEEVSKFNPETKKMEKTTIEKQVPWDPSSAKINAVLDALASILYIDEDVETPSWIASLLGDGYPEQVESAFGSNDNLIISCQNGLLRVADRELIPQAPSFFNLLSVPFDYDPTAKAPRWEQFLKEAWPNDPECIDALQEWFGYILSGRMDLHKILFIKGISRSGKGTIAKVLQTIVGGKRNYSSANLTTLGGDFGAASLIGKGINIIADMRPGPAQNANVLTERLLNISSGDSMDIARKHKDTWTGVLPTRLVIMSNIMPKFQDDSGAISKRLFALEMRISHAKDPDTNLGKKIISTEMPGIFNWSLKGLDRLAKQGKFTEPECSSNLVRQMVETAVPLQAFLRENCVLRESATVDVDDLFKSWEHWAEANDVKTPRGKAAFGTTLGEVMKNIDDVGFKKSRGSVGGKRVNIYRGIGLLTEYSDHDDVNPAETENQPTITETRHSGVTPKTIAMSEKTPTLTSERHDVIAKPTQHSSDEISEPQIRSHKWFLGQKTGEHGTNCDGCQQAPGGPLDWDSATEVNNK